MAFCVKCGTELASGTKFCPECGTPVEILNPGEHIHRDHVYVGVVKKCPVCGEELPSMAAVCPACGHEINSTQVHPALQELIDELEQCDQSIADEEAADALREDSNTVREWHSWSTFFKIIWVVVNCLTLCVPIVVRSLFYSWKSPKSTPNIKRKANLIENFQIPSDRQAIIESLYFIRDKVSALMVKKATPETVYWAKLWDVKNSQIYKKAQSSIPNDATVSGLFREIISSVHQIKSRLIRKNIFLGIAFIVYIACVVAGEALVIRKLLQIINTIDISSLMPIVWGLGAVILLALLIWGASIVRQSRFLKGILVVGILITPLVLLARSCQKSEAAAADFSTQIGNKCSENDMILSNVSMNEYTKVASIKIQSSVYDKSSIDKAETGLFAIAMDYNFELSITFSDQNGLTIRECEIDEYGAVNRSTDNTNGIIEFVKAICSEKGATLYQIDNLYNNEIEFDIQVPTVDRSVIMDDLQQELSAAKTQFGYSGYEIEFRTMDKYYGNLLRTIEVDADGSIFWEERISEFTQDSVDAIISRAVSQCQAQKISMSVDIVGENGIWWRSYIDATGNQTNIDAYNFRTAAQAICDKEGVELYGIYTYGKGLSISIYSDTKRQSKIDKVENQIIEAYREYSELNELTIYFDYTDEKAENRTIRETRIDSSGIVSHEDDNTTLF